MRYLIRTRCGWLLGCGLALLLLTAIGCGRQSAPRVPPDLPQTMPSAEEAQRAREDAREAIPILPEGERGLGREDLPPGAQATGEETEHPQRYGYRVQLFATSDRELAEEQAAEYRQTFDESIYVVFEGILYKVRAGDCVSRDEADALRREAIGLGCEGAFIIDTLVYVR